MFFCNSALLNVANILNQQENCPHNHAHTIYDSQKEPHPTVMSCLRIEICLPIGVWLKRLKLVFFVALLVCFIGVCHAFVVVHRVSLLISIPFCALLLFLMFCWWSSLPLWYVLLVVINASHCTCWCSLFSCHVLLVLIIAPVLCFVGVHWHPLLHFVDVRHGPLVAFYWCSLLAFCYTMLVFDNGRLLCVYQCSSSPSCYILLVLVNGCMLCFVSTFLTFLLIDIPLLCSIVVHWYPLDVFCWCSLGFQISICLVHFFFQVCRSGSSSFFCSTSSNIFQ